MLCAEPSRDTGAVDRRVAAADDRDLPIRQNRRSFAQGAAQEGEAIGDAVGPIAFYAGRRADPRADADENRGVTLTELGEPDIPAQSHAAASFDAVGDDRVDVSVQDVTGQAVGRYPVAEHASQLLR